VPAEHVHDVLAGRRQRVVDHGRHDGGQERAARPASVTGVLVGGLQVLDVRADVRVARRGEAALGRVEGRETRRRLDGEVQLECG
jgi:hypothetical protein